MHGNDVSRASACLAEPMPSCSNISAARRVILAGSLACFLWPTLSPAQTPAPTATQSVLQRRYEAAQKYQSANDLPHAADQYRIFIADALGQIAVDRAHAGQNEKAADDFDEALRLVPHFPLLQLEYARAALASGNLQRAKSLATSLVAEHGDNAKVIAGAYAVLGRVLLKLNKDAEAKHQLEQAVALDPSFENGYELAIADLDLGDHDGAAQIFKEMTASFGDTPILHLYFGQAYGTSDFQTDAIREFQEAVAKDKRLPGVHYALAAAYLATAGGSRLADAQTELHEEITIDPKNAEAYAALGHLLAAQHAGQASDAEAEADLKHATELDPRNPDAFLYLGQFLAEAKRPQEAEAALRSSIALTTDPSRNAYQVQKAHYLLGRLLLQTGQAEAGKQEIATAQTLMQQGLTQDQERISDYLQEKKNDAVAMPAPAMPMAAEQKPLDPEAVRQVDAFEKQIGPAIADSYNNLGAIAGSEGDYPTALRCFERTAEWNPTMPGLDNNWGRAAFAAGAFAEAIPMLSRSLQTQPGNDDLRAALGVSEFMSAQYDAARSTLQPLVGKGGESREAQYAYAVTLLKTGDMTEGIRHLKTLETAAPEMAEVHRALGEAFAEQKTPGAVAELETAVRLNPKDAEAHAALGRLQLSHGDAKDAVSNLQIALNLQPGNAALREELAEAARKAGTH